MRDFVGAAAQPGAAPTTSVNVSAERFTGVTMVLLSQFGIAASLIAGWGAWSAARRRPGWAGPIAVALVFNLLAAGLVIHLDQLPPRSAENLAEGALYVSLFAGVAFIAWGMKDLLERVRSTTFRPLSGLKPERASAALAAALTFAILAPALALNREAPAVEKQPLSDRFASTILKELPPKSVLLIWSAERSDPIIYRQLAFGERQDVTVVVSTGLATTWYREQASRRLGLAIQPTSQTLSSLADSVVNLARELRQQGRAVYFEMPAARFLGGHLGYRPVGLSAEFVDGAKHGSVGGSSGFHSEVTAALRSGGLPGPEWSTFPNTTVRKTYTSAIFEVALDDSRNGQYADAEQALQTLLEIDPANNEAKAGLRSLSSLPSK